MTHKNHLIFSSSFTSFHSLCSWHRNPGHQYEWHNFLINILVQVTFLLRLCLFELNKKSPHFTSNLWRICLNCMTWNCHSSNCKTYTLSYEHSVQSSLSLTLGWKTVVKGRYFLSDRRLTRSLLHKKDPNRLFEWFNNPRKIIWNKQVTY